MSESLSQTAAQPKPARAASNRTPLLDQLGVDLTAASRAGKLDPVIGREKEIGRVIQILSRRTKNNPALIGEPGVGKTAIVEGLGPPDRRRVTSRRRSRISGSSLSTWPVSSPGPSTAASSKSG